jgi:hypothetical protein
MKTPREILFDRHRQAESRLDAVREKALAAVAVEGTTQRLQPNPSIGSLFQAVLRKAWSELIWPSRRAWAGMAAVWLAVVAANLEWKTTLPAVPAIRSVRAHEVAQAFEEQRRLLAELLPTAEPLPPDQAPGSWRKQPAVPASGTGNSKPDARPATRSQMRGIPQLDPLSQKELWAC